MNEQPPPTCVLADVLHLVGALGGALSPPLREFAAAHHPVMGAATTVQLEPAGRDGSLEPLYRHLDQTLDGRVVVLAGAASIPGAVWGQILSRAAGRSGTVAALVDGGVRDRASLGAEGVPVWGRCEETLGAVGTARVAAVDVDVRIAGMRIAPGDCVVVDTGGVVVIDRSAVETTFSHADEYARAEASVLDDLARGIPLSEAYDHKRRIVYRLRQE